MKWLKTIWVKLVIEVAVTILIWLLFKFGKNYLPRRFGVKDETLKKGMKFITTLIANVPSEEDSISEVLIKSKNIVEFLQDERLKALGIAESFKQQMAGYPGVEVQYDTVFASSILPHVAKYAKNKTMIMEIDLVNGINKYDFEVNGEMKEVYTIVSATNDGETSNYPYIATTKGFNPNSLLDFVFSEFNDKIFITALPDGSGITIEPLNHEIDGDYKTPQAKFDDLHREITKCKEAGYQRSYILNGEPGTGKTSFCIELSRRMSGKVLKMDSSFFNYLQSNTCKKIIQAFNIDCLIVDDIDRISFSDMPAFLYLLETLKSYKNKPTLLATVNQIEKLDQAVIRPGRFDDIIEFELPNYKERCSFIEEYCKNHDIKITSAEVGKIAKAADEVSHAYLKEFCLQFRILGDADALATKIKTRKKYLSMVQDRLGEVMEDSDIDELYNEEID